MKRAANDEMASRFARVKIFLCDVDGVLTDCTVMSGSGRQEFKRFNIQDGMGLRLLRESGIPVGWISNRPSVATARRAKELRVDFLWQGTGRKVDAIEAILKQAKLDWADACFVSDDVNDLPVLLRVGLPIAVANAVAEVRAVSHYATRASGGEGAVREVAERLLKAQGRWTELIQKLKEG